MKQIKLMNLTLSNFKGVKNFTLDASGEDVKVFGDNATGKTTVYDAFLWLLFNKDSSNNSKFAIKTLDENGEEARGLEHAVEAILSIDGKPLTLKKIYKEVWSKKRNSPTAEFKGHTNDYFIDGVPSKQKEYDALISELIDEDVFKLLTNPAFFNEHLKPDQRRKILLEVCGDISDQEVINQKEELAKLPDILANRTLEKHKEFIVSKRKEINKELDKIPVRIDEIQHNLPSLEGLDKPTLEAEINNIDVQINEKQDLISSVRNGNAITEKQKQIQEIEIELLKVKQEHETSSGDGLMRLKMRIQEEESNITILNRKKEENSHLKKLNNENIISIDKLLTQLRQDWTEINNWEFEHADSCECPTCGQSLPQEQIDETRDKALAQFNLKKSKQLEDTQSKGERGKKSKQVLLEENEKLDKESEKFDGQITEKQELIAKLKSQISQIESTIVDVTENVQYVSLLQEKQKLTEEINELKLSADQSIQAIQMEIIDLKSKRDQLQSELGKFIVVTQSEIRIKELLQRERELAAEFERLEEELFLIEEFTRTKVDMLDKKINSKFKFARFKLFETQINGGLKDICVTTYEGVPYDKGLNNAAKINVGLDIINTLSDFYGFSAPIFVDNAEAVTKLIDTDAQLISLIVSGQDKQLRVENIDLNMKEAI